YIETCKTLITTVPEVTKTIDAEEKIRIIESHINLVPSLYDKVFLLNNLALKCYISGLEQKFSGFAEKCLALVESCEDEEVHDNCINIIAPTLFLYERGILFQKFEQLPEVQKNNALYQVSKVLLSKRVPGEKVDLKALKTRVEYKEALQICDVLEKMTEDATISVVISGLVDLLIEPAPGNKIRGRFQEKQLLSIADRLRKISLEKLPDNKNISHEGYLLIAFA